MAQPTNNSIITNIRVVPLEVDALYDLPSAPNTQDKPMRLLTEDGRNGFRLDLVESYYNAPPRYYDEAGRELDFPIRQKRGIYRPVSVEGSRPLYRTFVEANSTPIDHKYLYVFSMEGTVAGTNVTIDHGTIKLALEVFCRGGDLAFVNLQKHADKDERPHDKPSGKSLLLPQLDAKKGQQKMFFYYFFLAPYQLPWEAAQDLAKTIKDRGVLLLDPFFTRIAPEGELSKAKPLVPPDQTIKSPTFVLHLVDPIKEGLKRAERLADALDAFNGEQAKLGADLKYRLAKRVDLLGGQSKQREVLKYSLTSYLLEKEKHTFRLNLLQEVLANDLISWIGTRQKDGTIQGSTHLIAEPDGKLKGFNWPLTNKEAYNNHYSQLAADYYLYDCTDEVFYELGQVLSIVSGRLKDTIVGRGWLERNFKKHEKGEASMADGGIGFLFREDFKTVHKQWKDRNKVAKAAVGFLTGVYSSAWVKAKSGEAYEEALKSVQNYFKYKTGEDIELVKPRAERRALLSENRREWKSALRRFKAGKEVPQLSFAKRDLSQLADKMLVPLTMAVEGMNAAYAVQKFVDSGDPFQALIAANAMAKSIDALGKIAPKFKVEGPTYKLWGQAAKIKPLGVVTNCVDTVLSARDAYLATNTQMTIGHSMKSLGYALAVGGAFTSETGVGIVVALLGVGLQMTGDYIAKVADDARKLLSHTEWGEPGVLGGIFSEYWWFPGGDARTMKESVDDQHRALNELLFNFEPTVEFGAGGVRVELGKANGMLISALIAREHAWSVVIKLSEPPGWNGPPPSTHVSTFTADDLQMEEVDGKTTLYFFVDTEPLKADPDWERVDYMTVRAEMELNLPIHEGGGSQAGDRALLRRSLDESIRFR